LHEEVFMKQNRIPVAALAVLCGSLAWTSLAAPDKTPTQSCLDYYAALQKAKTVDEVLPYLSAEFRSMIESQPKSERPVWLGRLRDGVPPKDLKITKETIDGDKCILEGTGTSAKGNALHGKIVLVKEGGAWKFDEEAWGT
jgi:hypothetical protein